MPGYTTGEIARLCNVSVRTVQYYDARGILVPSALSEGGRRLYSEKDLEKMRIICFLKSLNLPLDSIREILNREKPEKVILLMLEEQSKALRDEIEEKQAQMQRIEETRKSLSLLPKVTADSMKDIACIVRNKAKMRKLHIRMLIVGFIMDALQIATLMVWIFTGKWWPFALGMGATLTLGIYISIVYYSSTAYICPECHHVFKSYFGESFFARHTPYTRRLTCPHCGYHGFCVETYGKEIPSC